MPSAPGQWSTIEHTADLAIEVQAQSLEQLFVVAGRGLAGLLLGRESGPGGFDEATEWRELELTASDRETLLVEWLGELLYLMVVEGLTFATAEFAELSESRLAGRAGLRPLAEDEVVERELKGVTYHDLEVSDRDGGWYARIVFDV